MAICPDCESTLTIDLDDVEEGETILCDECGTEFEVTGTEPLALSKLEDDGYEDEDSSSFATEEEE